MVAKFIPPLDSERVVGGKPVQLVGWCVGGIPSAVPVTNIAGTKDLFFAPPASAHRLGALLPNSPHVRLETAPGGHLGVLTGKRARETTWRSLIEFLRDGDHPLPVEDSILVEAS